MKTNPKIALVVLITALAIAVFVWAYIKKGQAKKEAKLDAEQTPQEPVSLSDIANLAVEPTTMTKEQKTVIGEEKSAPDLETAKNALQVIYIDLKYDAKRKVLEYDMNYQGSIVRGIYQDTLLPEYNGDPVALLREEHNGVLFEVMATSFIPSIGTEKKTNGALVNKDVTTKGGAAKGLTGTSSKLQKIGADTDVGELISKPNSILLSINKADGEVLEWKIVDLITGEIYNGIKGMQESGATYKEGDLSKTVYYLK